MSIRVFDHIILLLSFFYLSLFITDYSFVSCLFGGPACAGINNLGAATAGLALVLTIRYLLDRGSFFESPLAAGIRRLSNLGGIRLCLLACGLLFICLAALSLARHFSLSSGASDLGIFDQAVWNTSGGNTMFSSLKGNVNLLGDHFEPVLFLFVPLYRLWNDASVLLVAQALLLSLAIFPLYFIARERLTSRALIFAVIISFMLSRPLRGIALSDFHPESFILLFSFWAYYFLIKKNNLLLLVSVLFMLASKEDAAFLVSALGIYAAIFEKRRGLGLSLFVLGIAAWILETKFFIPVFSATGRYPYMDRLPFAPTYAGNIRAVISDPALLGRIFLDKHKIGYFLKFIGPLAFLPLLSPRHYILIAAPLLRNILPVDPAFSGHYNITSHYTASLLPFVYIAAIYGADNLAKRLKSPGAPFWAAIFIMIASLFYYGKTDAHKFRRFTGTISRERTLEKISYLRQIPPGASVSANFNLVPHLAHRKYIFEWNPVVKSALVCQYLVIDTTLLEYLGGDDIPLIPAYLRRIEALGFKQVFEARGGTFVIYHNPGIELGQAENLFR